MSYQCKFEKLKFRAKNELARTLNTRVINGMAGYRDDSLFDMLVIVTLDRDFRRKMTEALKGNYPNIPATGLNLSNVALSILHDEADRIIDAWDVRQIRGLINAFPGIVSKKYRHLPIYCYMEDSDDSPWIVYFEANEDYYN